jgi:SAM-dependent methyltransferase
MSNRPLWLTHQAGEEPYRGLVELDHCWQPPWPAEWWVHRKQWLAARIGEGEDVFDLGCGIGLLAAYLRHAGHRGIYVGVDWDQKYLEVAVARNLAEGNDSAIFLPRDLRSLDIAREIDDYWGPTEDRPVVVLEQVLEHLSQEQAEALLDRIPAGIRVLALVSRPLYVRAPGWSNLIQGMFEARFDDVVLGQVDDERREARGWAYGVVGVKR